MKPLATMALAPMKAKAGVPVNTGAVQRNPRTSPTPGSMMMTRLPQMKFWDGTSKVPSFGLWPGADGSGRPNFPLYHTLAILSRVFAKKVAQIQIPKLVQYYLLTFAPGCDIL